MTRKVRRLHNEHAIAVLFTASELPAGPRLSEDSLRAARTSPRDILPGADTSS